LAVIQNRGKKRKKSRGPETFKGGRGEGVSSDSHKKREESKNVRVKTRGGEPIHSQGTISFLIDQHRMTASGNSIRREWGTENSREVSKKKEINRGRMTNRRVLPLSKGFSLESGAGGAHTGVGKPSRYLSDGGAREEEK